ncbi:trichothecene efflux pump [Eremomyces bilateralis CBS 781.70]|uniref:Trichothecene efflux pump n=1 Tax=Eremomyces bilateralis CBS 781.70 TaxID=1392243 RepID=A0A6G1G424_9PEZI|nr:trichothecene efflux pump [Eremomyces bilateralis CBS 781.70]KAF1812768.1 trichothecene efflux pump [Eremomyces bilateralis CBS 781.70]
MSQSFQFGYLSDVFVISLASAVLGDINNDIGPSTAYSWMATAQIISAAVLSPLVGRLGDIFGRKTFLLLGNTIGAVGCAVAATAHEVSTIIVASIFIGFGAAMHQLAWSCLAEVVPRSQRAFALGLFQVSLTPASLFAAVIGKSLVVHASWRYCYWIPFALDIAGLVLIVLFYHPINQFYNPERKTKFQQFKELDWIGLFLFAAGLTLFLLGITFGGSEFPWKSAGPICMIVLGFLTLVALGFYEAHASLEYALFPPVVLGNIRGCTMVLLTTALAGMLYYSTILLWPMMVEKLFAKDQIQVGWYCTALGAGGVLASPICGWAFRKWGKFARYQFTLYAMLLTACCGAQAHVGINTNISCTVLTVLLGMGLTGATLCSTTMVQLGQKHEYIGIATAMAITARSIGGCLATTIYTSIIENKIGHNLVPGIAKALLGAGLSQAELPEAIEAIVEKNAAILRTLPQSVVDAGLIAMKMAYINAFKLVYYVSITFGILGCLAAFSTAEVGHLMTEKVDIKLREGLAAKDRDTDEKK